LDILVLFIRAYKRSIFHHSISYYSLGAQNDRRIYQLVPTYFCSTFVSVCCWKCVQTKHSYWSMKCKVCMCIVMCMQLEITVLLRSTLIKEFTDQWDMPFPWLTIWPVQYNCFIGKRYYFLGHSNTDKICSRDKRQNETLIGRCITVLSVPGLSSCNASYVELLLTIFVEFVMCGSHVRRSSILALHSFWKHCARLV